jgi:hypothetical protein
MLILPGQLSADHKRLFSDKKFVQWATLYINKMAYHAAVCKRFEMTHALRREAHAIRHPIFDVQWTEFYKYNFDSCNKMDIKASQVRSLLKPLWSLFCNYPDSIDGEDDMGKGNKSRSRRNRKKKINKMLREANFVIWANRYLMRVYCEVIKCAALPEVRNPFLISELQSAATFTGMGHFFRFANYADIDVSNFRIDNPRLLDFLRPLRYIYDNSTASRQAITVGTTQHVKNKKTKSDLETEPSETIHVTMHPVVVESKVHSPYFGDNVLRVLTHCLKTQGLRWYTSQKLADFFGVDRRNFEEWADQCPNLRRRNGQEGVVLYGLAPPRFPKRKTMTTTKPNDTMTTELGDTPDVFTNTEHPADVNGKPNDDEVYSLPNDDDDGGTTVEDEDDTPKIGSDAFDRLVSQLLTNSKKLWRTSSTIASKMDCDEDDFIKWADANPALLRRPSKDKDKVYYCMAARMGEKDKDKDKDNPTQTVIRRSPPHRPATNYESAAAGGNNTTTTKNAKPALPYTQKEILALGMLHMTCDQLIRIMNTYANTLATYHGEAFSHFTKGQADISAGVALLEKSLKVKQSNLPSLDNI